MNSVMLIGRLTRDPELRYSTGSNQTAICRFSIAINSGYGDNQRTDYPNIVVFGKQAENCDRYLNKGSQVAIEGRIQTGSYEKDGRKVYTTDVIANRVEFLGGKSGGQAQGGSFGGGQNRDFGGFDNAPVQTQGGEPMDVPGFQAIDDDDIPF